MKALTVKQPFASLIMDGIKSVENRTWKTNYRGKLLIHAAVKPVSLKLDIEGQASAQEILMFTTLNKAEENDLFGVIIGTVDLLDVVINHQSSWALQNHYHWVLANPYKFPEPIKAKGKLSLWEYDHIKAEPEEKDGPLFCHCQLPVAEKVQVMSLLDTCRCYYCNGIWYK